MRQIIAGRIETKSKITKNLTMVDLIIISIAIVITALFCSLDVAFGGKICFIFFMVLATTLNITQIGNKKGYIELGETFSYIIRKKHTLGYSFEGQARISATETLKIDNTYTAIYEINGIDFYILDGYSQDNIIETFKLIVDEMNEGSFMKVQKEVDYTSYVENLERYKQVLESREQKNGNATLLDVCNIHQTYLSYYTNEMKVKADYFYLVIKENSPKTITSLCATAERVLEQCGLVAKRLENDEILDFLSRTLCADKNCSPKLDEKYRTIAVNGQPKKIVQISRYPYMVGNAWISSLFNLPNATVSMNFKRYGGKDLTKSINNAMKEAGSNMMSGKATYTSQKEEQGKREALDEVSEAIVFLDEKIFDVQTYIMFNSGEEKEPIKKLKAEKFLIDYSSGNQREAFINLQPYSRMESKYKRYNMIQIQASAVASSFPYVTKRLHDEQGMYLGYNDNQVFFDPFERNTMRTNSNMAIIGSSGKGKSFLMKKLILELSCRNIKFFILDPEDEYRELCNSLEGNYVDVAGSYKNKINPLQVFPSLKENGETDCSEDIAQHRLFLQEFFKLILPSLTDEQLVFIDNAVAELYTSFGIIDGTNLNDLKNEDYPIFDDLLAIIDRKGNDTSLKEYEQQMYFQLSYQLRAFGRGGLYEANWNGYTTLELNNNFNVLNFRSLFANNNKTVANAQMLLVMRFINLELIRNKTYNDQKLKENKDWQVRHIVEIVDEGHNFINPNYPIALDKMQQTSRQVRKYFGAFWFATQNITDFVGGGSEIKAKASAIIDNCKFSALLGMQQNDLNVLVDLYANSRPFTTAEISQLSRGERGRVLLALDSDTRLSLQIEAFEEEVGYFDKNASILMQKQREKEQASEEEEQTIVDVIKPESCIRCEYCIEKIKRGKSTFYCSKCNKSLGFGANNIKEDYKLTPCPLDK